MALSITPEIAHIPGDREPAAHDGEARIGVVDYGHRGPDLVRNFGKARGARVVAVSYLREERLAHVHGRCPAVRSTTHYGDACSAAAVR